MRVLIAGATAWDNADAIRRELSELPPEAVVVHGDSPGADALAGEVARELQLRVEPFAKSSEDYRRYRRGAWKALNERMLAAGIELVLAFHPAVEKSKGTKHLVGLATAAGVPVRIIEG